MKERSFAGLGATVLAIGILGAPVAAAPLPKVDICHFPAHDGDFFTEGNGQLEFFCQVVLGGHVIRVSGNAVPAHDPGIAS